MAAAVRLLLFRGIRMRGPLGVGDWCQLIGCSCPRTCVRRGRRATRGCPPRAVHASPVKTGETTVPRSRSRGTAGRLFVQACTEGGMHACPGGCCRRPQLPLSVWGPTALPSRLWPAAGALRVRCRAPRHRCHDGAHPPPRGKPSQCALWSHPREALRRGVTQCRLHDPGGWRATRCGARVCGIQKGHPTPAVGACPLMQSLVSCLL